jgi:hypothetical protein
MMVRRVYVLIWLLLVLGAWFSASPVGATPILLSNVPAYNWYHGCGPTAAGSVVGYWDLHGYPDLFNASGWSNVSLTKNVQDQISSPEHNARYDPKPDDLTKPQSWNSIADWFHTSEGTLNLGWSYLSYADDAFIGYTNYRGYTFSSWNEWYGAFTWEDLVNEIDSCRPMMFLVDSSGSGDTDHFVPVLGYDDRGADGKYYGLYTTWSEAETVEWRQFRSMSSSYTWGVGAATFVHPVSEPIPEPATVLLIGSGLLGLLGIRRRRKEK